MTDTTESLNSLSARQLFKLFRLLSDETRVRLLRLLTREELSVNELAYIAEISQPRVSNHLKTLREEGLVIERRDGSWRHYRVEKENLDSEVLALWPLLESAWNDMEAYKADDYRLRQVLAQRRPHPASEFFDQLSENWDEIRAGLFGEALGKEILRAFLPKDLVVADIGCGTGNVLSLFHPGAMKLIAIDSSENMLKRAEEKLRNLGANNVDIRLGDAHDPPLAKGEAGLITIVNVLHHLEEPEKAVREALSRLHSGDIMIINDFLEHQQRWLQTDLRHQWLGFNRQKVSSWVQSERIEMLSWEILPGRLWNSNDGVKLLVPDSFVCVLKHR